MYSDLFGKFEKLLKVDILGKKIEVPENNTLLRGFQFAAPDTISYGRFCWNGSCNNCTVTVREGSCEQKGLACRVDACEGMQIVAVSSEIKRNLQPVITPA
jgi:hypothetical protein